MAPKIAVTISRQDLQDYDVPTATITEVKHLASYSWIEAPVPTIAVPGIPPKWSPPSIPRRLPKDSGLIYIAQNAARHPESPLEPLFRALYIADPAFDIRSIDLVSDRNNIRKLLSFVAPSSSRDGLEDFTINVEATGNTVIFCRTETKTTEFIGPREFRGFGHEFEKAYTTCQITGSTGHHRIVSYRFGGLNFIIRHEVDGYVQDGTGTPSSSNQGIETDGLSALLGSMSLSARSGPHKESVAAAGSKMVVREAGHTVPLESTLEIKTRVAHRPLQISDVAPQLWVSQTPKLVRAYHRNGMFAEPQVEDVTAEIRAWERDNQGNLMSLAVLIRKILGVVRGYGGSAVVKYDSKIDQLVVVKVDRERMLPEDLYPKWDGMRDKAPGVDHYVKTKSRDGHGHTGTFD